MLHYTNEGNKINHNLSYLSRTLASSPHHLSNISYPKMHLFLYMIELDKILESSISECMVLDVAVIQFMSCTM